MLVIKSDCLEEGSLHFSCRKKGYVELLLARGRGDAVKRAHVLNIRTPELLLVWNLV